MEKASLDKIHNVLYKVAQFSSWVVREKHQLELF
jgi:hypothetical protein